MIWIAAVRGQFWWPWVEWPPRSVTYCTFFCDKFADCCRYYSATIIKMAGIQDTSTAIWLAALTAFVNFACTFVGLFLVDRIGRRPLSLGSLAGELRSSRLCSIVNNFFINQWLIFRSTLRSRPNKVGLERPYVRPSTKSFFDLNEIRYMGRGRWVMHDGMQYDPIQG